jgi:hypothetical protein
MAGQHVSCVVQAASLQFDIWHGASRIKQLPIKGLHGTPLAFEDYVAGISREARSEYQRYLRKRRGFHQGRLWS